MASDFNWECFFIAPIGADGSEIRKRSDGVRDWIVKPAVASHRLKVIRADDVGEPGQITAQAVEHCLQARAAVADLTGGNPNVYYELSVRHGAQLPVVLIAEQGTPLPFDISQSRVIFFDHTDLASAGKAKAELEQQIRASLTGTPDNPIADGMRLAQLQDSGDVEGQALARVLSRLDRLTAAVDGLAKDQALSLRHSRPSARFERLRRLSEQDPGSLSIAEYNEMVELDKVRREEEADIRAEALAEIRESGRGRQET